MREETPPAARDADARTSSAGDDDWPRPPIVSPDGRLFWDGDRWVELPRQGRSFGRVLLVAVFALALVAGLGTSAYVDLSGLPMSVPLILEHCAVRQPGSNVIVHFQGIDAETACRRAGIGWDPYVGPPVGALACYRQQ